MERIIFFGGGGQCDNLKLSMDIHVSQTGTQYIETDNMANSPQLLLNLRLPELAANRWPTVS